MVQTRDAMFVELDDGYPTFPLTMVPAKGHAPERARRLTADPAPSSCAAQGR